MEKPSVKESRGPGDPCARRRGAGGTDQGRTRVLTGEAPLLCLEGVEDDESDQNKDDQTGDDDADHGGHGHGLC